jgi:hypothetical protein
LESLAQWGNHPEIKITVLRISVSLQLQQRPASRSVPPILCVFLPFAIFLIVVWLPTILIDSRVINPQVIYPQAPLSDTAVIANTTTTFAAKLLCFATACVALHFILKFWSERARTKTEEQSRMVRMTTESFEASLRAVRPSSALLLNRSDLEAGHNARDELIPLHGLGTSRDSPLEQQALLDLAAGRATGDSVDVAKLGLHPV